LVHFVLMRYIFPVWVSWTKKNLATLMVAISWLQCNGEKDNGKSSVRQEESFFPSKNLEPKKKAVMYTIPGPS
jgi:hypothetical protein